MNTKPQDGGSAFPRATEQTVMGWNGTLEGERGITTRDYFASQALIAIIAKLPPLHVREGDVEPDKKRESIVATYMPAAAQGAYAYADAMLIERAK